MIITFNPNPLKHATKRLIEYPTSSTEGVSYRQFDLRRLSVPPNDRYLLMTQPIFGRLVSFEDTMYG